MIVEIGESDPSMPGASRNPKKLVLIESRIEKSRVFLNLLYFGLLHPTYLPWANYLDVSGHDFFLMRNDLKVPKLAVWLQIRLLIPFVAGY